MQLKRRDEEPGRLRKVPFQLESDSDRNGSSCRLRAKQGYLFRINRAIHFVPRFLKTAIESRYIDQRIVVALPMIYVRGFVSVKRVVQHL